MAHLILTKHNVDFCSQRSMKKYSVLLYYCQSYMYISSAIKSQIIFCFQADWTVLGSAANFVILLKFFGQHNEKKRVFVHFGDGLLLHCPWFENCVCQHNCGMIWKIWTI